MEIIRKRKKLDSVSDYNVCLSEELKRVFPLDRNKKAELIVGKSEILDIDDIPTIVEHVVKACSCAWSLAYSSSIHKRTLSDFYSRLSYVSATESPLILLAKDTRKDVRGVFLPSFNLGDSDGEAWGGELFHCRPVFSHFEGMTEHPLLMLKQPEFMSIVDKSGKCGIWFDSKLEEMRTEEYGNSILKTDESGRGVLDQRFEIKTFECWMLSEIELNPTKFEQI